MNVRMVAVKLTEACIGRALSAKNIRGNSIYNWCVKCNLFKRSA